MRLFGFAFGDVVAIGKAGIADVIGLERQIDAYLDTYRALAGEDP